LGLLEEGENVQFFQHYSTQASLNLGGDFALCENETRTIQPYVRGEGLTYRWSDGTTEPTLEVSAPGNYWVEVTNSFGCVLRDAVTVTGLASPPQVALPDTLIYCEGTPLTVQAPDKYLGYRWNEGAGKDSTFTVTDTGYVRLDVLNKAGCTATDSVYVGLRLPPVLDLGRDTALCPGDTLRLDAAVGEPASYLWNTGSADSSLLVVDSTGTYEVQVAVDNCVLQDAVEVLYYPKLPEPILTGSGVVCPGVVGVPYGIANREGSTYAWEVQGGAFQIPSGPDTLILVDWGASNSSASVAVQETTENGCVVEKARLPVRIQVALEPDTPRGEALVCANDSVQVYTTSFTPGSVYNWQLAEGGRILAGQGTSEVTVLWEQEGQWPLWVGESSITVDTVCDGASDTLRVAVYRDSATLDLAYVTRLGPESQGVEISIRSTNMPDTTILRLFRRPSGGPWQQVLEPGSQTGLLVDAPGLVPPVWEYESRQLNGCNQWVRSPTHTTLAMAQDTATSLATSTQLYWNPYREWPGGVVRYLLYRQLDQEPTYQLYTEIPGSDTAYLYSAGAEGFLHRFYVVAEGAVPQQRSLSLGVTATFENPLRFPTVFTPNADGFNDTYVIDNAPLYTPNSLTVVNRHGEVVFSQTDYDNTWNGGNLPEGVYYFLFESPGTNQPVKGVITLLR
ncbi:MAG TPA: hypothetical protein DCR93_31090, partial [Cytophagales bacterium]|nr:hypothetical protein [Cytophagales bacterium]